MVANRLSVILPARNEEFLKPTIEDLLKKATGDLEVIAVLDGWWPTPPLPDDKRVHILHWGTPHGMRPSINAGIQMSTGEFVMKLDAHCAVAAGFDEILKKHCGPEDVVIPAKYSLDPETWSCKPKPPWYYFWLTWPWDPSLPFMGLQDKNYDSKYNAAREEMRVDDILAYQGSAWMIPKKRFELILPEGMDHEHYYFHQEPVEVGIRNWLSDGRVRIVKDTWYAHLWKGNAFPRTFPREKAQWESAFAWSARYWMTNQWKNRTRDFKWVVEKFWPLPGWPDNWEEEVTKRFA